MILRVLLLFAIIASAPAAAHEIRPAFLQIRELGPETYDVFWKTPAQGEMRLALNVILPVECRTLGEPRITLVNAAVVQHWRTHCDQGLLGRLVVIENLETTLTDVLLRFEPIAGSAKTLRIHGAEPSAVIPARQSTSAVAGTYLYLGLEHILLGFDHLLFVLCLLMLVNNPKRLLAAITAFTLAHSITLAGTTFGWLRLAISPVEACIALSIALIAAEIIKTRSGKRSLVAQRPWIAAFGFGLLHGFGFASALSDIGLPEDGVPLALLFFNLGVEAGQILFVGIILALSYVWRRYAPQPPIWAWRAPPYAAGIVASFWFIDRTVRIFI